MTADDCVKVIAGVAAAQAATIAALAKVYVTVRSNSQRLKTVAAVVGPDATMGANRA